MSPEKYQLDVPKGALRFVSVYGGSPAVSGGERVYGCSVPLQHVGDLPLDGVRLGELDGEQYITVRSRSAPEVDVVGMSDNDPEKWRWMEEQMLRLEMRNLSKNHIFAWNACRLHLLRYEIKERRFPLYSSGWGFGLSKVELFAHENDS